MPQTRVLLSVLVVPSVAVAGCYSPNVPLVASAGNAEASGSSGGTVGDSDASPASTSTTQDAATDPGTEGTSETGGVGSETSSGATHGRCGDSSVDEGEDCDDGNEINADGCNSDCVESGSTVWTVDFATDYDLPDAPQSGLLAFSHVDVAPSGEIGVAMRILSNGNDGILVGGLSEDGETAWTDVISSAEVDHQYLSLIHI